jgi:hypothetical protein
VAVTLVLVLTSIDLIGLYRGFNPAIPRAHADPPVPASVRFLQRRPPGSRMIGDTDSLASNLAIRYGLDDARQYDLPIVGRYRALYGALGGPGPNPTSWEIGDPRQRRLIDVFGVDDVLASAPAPRGARDLRLEFRGPGEFVYSNRTALPRAWVAHTWRAASGEQAGVDATVRSPTARLLTAPIIERAPAAPGTGGPPEPARVRRRGTDGTVIDVQARAPGQLVVLDTYYPGWKATVDGRAAPIRPANGAFEAIPVPAGSHVVELSYHPRSVRIGIWISILATALLAAAGAAVAVRARRARRTG